MNVEGKGQLDLESLIGSLRDVVSNVNDSLVRDQESSMRRIIDMGEDGQPEYITWCCVVTSPKGGEQSYEMLRMPVSALKCSHPMYISELSTEFDASVRCPVELARISHGFSFSEFQSYGRKSKVIPLRHVKITLRGPDGDHVAISVEQDDSKNRSFSESADKKENIPEERYGFFKDELWPYFCDLFRLIVVFFSRFVCRRKHPY